MRIEKKRGELKSRIKTFFSNKYNLYFLGILLFAIILRLYYFFLTKSQPLWWDESDYLAYAKNLAGFNVNWNISPQHNSLFVYVVAAFFKIGLSEQVAKFVLEVIPSIILIFLAYKVCLLMYEDKRIALITSFLMAVLWNVLFNTSRFHLGIPGLFFALLAIYVFWQGYERKEKIFGKINPSWAVPLTVIFVILTYATRRGYFLFGIFFLVYMLLTKSPRELLKDKYNWVAFGIVAILFFLSESFIFSSKISGVAGTYYNPQNALSLDSLHIFGTYFNSLQGTLLANVFTYLFWIGFIGMILSLILGFSYSKRSEMKSGTKSNLFNLVSILATLGFFIFMIRVNFSIGANYEPRWMFPLLFASFVCIAQASLFITDFVKKHSRIVALVFLLLLLGFGGYHQIQHADFIIKNKIPTYEGIKQAGLFLKEISSPEDIIATVPQPQASYYAERNVASPKKTLEEFLVAARNESNLRYLIVSFSEPNHPEWLRKENQEYNINPTTGQPMLVQWEIPFMDTAVDFINQQQKIEPTKAYGDITFNLITIKEDTFVYEIQRQ